MAIASWNSPRGQRSVDHVGADGRIYVRTEGNPLLHIYRDDADLACEIRIDEASAMHRAKQKQAEACEKAAAEEARAEKIDLPRIHGWHAARKGCEDRRGTQ